MIVQSFTVNYNCHLWSKPEVYRSCKIEIFFSHRCRCLFVLTVNYLPTYRDFLM